MPAKPSKHKLVGNHSRAQAQVADDQLQPEFGYVFETSLGYTGLVWREEWITSVVFGRSSRAQAIADSAGSQVTTPPQWIASIARRIERFTRGTADDFADLPLELSQLAPFSRAVIDGCRAIPLGETRSYADLAMQAGSPRAARAVGSAMRTNRFPLVIPCHRVVASGGKIGGYSAPDGLDMKRRLLALEQAILAKSARKQK